MKHSFLLFLASFFSTQLAALPISFPLEQQTQAVLSKLEQKYLAAAKLFQAGDFEAAKVLFKELVDRDPGHIEARLALAEIQFQQNNLDQAARLIEEALALSPDSDSAHISHGKVMYLKKDYKAAEKAFQRAITLSPKNFDARINLADMYMATQSENIDIILQAYDSALLVNPDHRGAQFAKGRLLLAKKDMVGAIIQLELATKDPVNAYPELLLGDIWLSRDDTKKAQSYYQSAIDKDPSFAPAWVALSNLQEQTNAREAAWNTLLKATLANPNNVFLWFQRGVKAQKQNRIMAAIEAYEKVITLNPQHGLAQNNLAWLLFEQNRELPRAYQLAQSAVKLAPENVSFQDTLQQIKLQLK